MLLYDVLLYDVLLYFTIKLINPIIQENKVNLFNGILS